MYPCQLSHGVALVQPKVIMADWGHVHILNNLPVVLDSCLLCEHCFTQLMTSLPLQMIRTDSKSLNELASDLEQEQEKKQFDSL